MLRRLMGGARRVAVRLRAKALVIVYHRVTHLASDPYGMTVSPPNFAEHLEVLKTWGTCVRLSDLVRAVFDGGRPPKRAVAVTFDDGYEDMLSRVKPMLERSDIPATAFICTGHAASQREFWWDRLEYLMGLSHLPSTLEMRIAGQKVGWGPGGTRSELSTRLYGALFTSDDRSRQEALEALFAWAGVAESTRPTHRVLRPEEIVALAAGGLVEIGAHTVTHPILSSLALDMQRREIDESRSLLESLVGASVNTFAYPFGQKEHYSSETIALLQSLGFTAACANFPGIVDLATDRFQLPRLQGMNVSGDRFERRLWSVV